MEAVISPTYHCNYNSTAILRRYKILLLVILFKTTLYRRDFEAILRKWDIFSASIQYSLGPVYDYCKDLSHCQLIAYR
jgi:hypothetical protein